MLTYLFCPCPSPRWCYKNEALQQNFYANVFEMLTQVRRPMKKLNPLATSPLPLLQSDIPQPRHIHVTHSGMHHPHLYLKFYFPLFPANTLG